MQSDDLYPSDGTYFMPREPEEQVVARKKESAQTLEGLSVLKDMVKRLDERIDFYQRHSNIPDEVRTDPSKFLIISNSYTMVSETLQSEKEWIEDLLESHAKNR